MLAQLRARPAVCEPIPYPGARVRRRRRADARARHRGERGDFQRVGRDAAQSAASRQTVIGWCSSRDASPESACPTISTPSRPRSSRTLRVGTGASRQWLLSAATATTSRSVPARSALRGPPCRRRSSMCWASGRRSAALSRRIRRSLGGIRLSCCRSGLWQRAFGGDPSVIEGTIRVNGQPSVVAGVMPATFAYRTEPSYGSPLRSRLRT